MSVSPQPATPHLRADARRNRERIVAAAVDSFAAEGVECQVAEIARRAGVGNATVFRHFPTKRDLLAAVVEARMQSMLAVADEALAMPDPAASLRHFLDAMCRVHVADHGLKQMAAAHFNGDDRLLECRDRLVGRLGEIVERAKAADCVRADAEAIDFVVLVTGVASAVVGLEEERPGLYRRYLEIGLAGMRPQAGEEPPLPSAAPTAAEVDAAWRRQAERRIGGC